MGRDSLNAVSTESGSLARGGVISYALRDMCVMKISNVRHNKNVLEQKKCLPVMNTNLRKHSKLININPKRKKKSLKIVNTTGPEGIRPHSEVTDRWLSY